MKIKGICIVSVVLVALLLLASCARNTANSDECRADTNSSQVAVDNGQEGVASSQEGTITIEIGDGSHDGFTFANQLHNTTKGLYYEENVEYTASVISDAFHPLGNFEDRESFDAALNKYLEVLTPLLEESEQFSDIQPFSFNLTESTGGGVYALSKDMSFSISVNCETDGYQSVDYSVSFFPHSSDNKITPKTVCQDVASYTGVMLMTQDIEHARDILNEVDTDTLYVEGLDGRTTVIFNALMLNTEREYWSISVTRII